MMPWLDETGAPVSDPMLLQQLGTGTSPPPAPSSQAGGQWKDESGTPVTDPVLLSHLGSDPWAGAAVPVGTPQSSASTGGYIGTRFLGSLMEAGKNAASESMYGTGPVGSTAIGQMQQLQAQPNQQQTVNQSIYGQPDVAPPNAAARYGGAVASAFGSNPVLGAMMPGYTAAGALGSEGASDLNKAYGPSWMPDWLARLTGGFVGSGVYGGAKSLASSAVAAATGGDTAINNADEIIQRIKNGEGRIGQFQTTANAAADSVSAANNPMPTVPGNTGVPLWQTSEALAGNGPMPDKAAQLAEAARKMGGTIPFSDAKAYQKEFVGTPLYGTLQSDMKSALTTNLGPDAASAFDQANLASRARYFLDQSQGAQGLYDPLKLTRNLARDPQTGALLSDVTPEMSQVADHAGQLAALVSPMVKANQEGPGMLTRAIPAGLGLLAEHSGLPGASMIGGMLFEHAGARAANPLYQLPSQPRLPKLIAPLIAGQSGLLGQSQ